jgi:phospholipase D
MRLYIGTALAVLLVRQVYRRISVVVALPVALGAALPAFAAEPAHGPVAAHVSACFVPAQACVQDIVAAIKGARQEVRVQAYGFTSAPILGALAAAKARGADVQVILDNSNDRTQASTGPEDADRRRSRYSGATYMANAGVPVWIDDAPAIAHNKIIVIDRRLVIGGSYNYTASAERRNAENVTFIDSPEVAEWFLSNWTSRRDASRPFRAEPAEIGALGGASPLAATADCAPAAACSR